MFERLDAFANKIFFTMLKWGAFAIVVYFCSSQASEIYSSLPGFWLPSFLSIIKLVLIYIAVIAVSPDLFQRFPLWAATHKFPLAARLPVAVLFVLAGSTLLVDRGIASAIYTEEERALIGQERMRGIQEAQSKADAKAKADAYNAIVPNIYNPELNRSPSPSREISTSQRECVHKGIKYFKEIGSYPTLKSTGEYARSVAADNCARTLSAFD